MPTAGEYAKSIDGIRLLTHHDDDPSAVSWDFRVPEGFSAESARLLFEQLPSLCLISFADPASPDDNAILVRRDGDNLIIRTGPQARWHAAEWADIISLFLSSPLVGRPVSGVTSFTVIQTTPSDDANPAPPPPAKKGGVSGFTFCIIALLILLLGCGWYSVGPGGDGDVSYLKLPDGTECLVTQQWNGWDDVLTEPYNVSFYFRKPGGSWGWCYLDHAANRWPRSEMIYLPEKNTVEVYHGYRLHAELRLNDSQFVLFTKNEGVAREFPAPQYAATPPYLPPSP